MRKPHPHRLLDLGNPLRNLAGNVLVSKAPSTKRVLNELLNAMSQFSGTCWMPVAAVKNGKPTSYDLMLNQCPGACGQVWRLNIKNEAVAKWLVNIINCRRHRQRRLSEPDPHEGRNEDDPRIQER